MATKMPWFWASSMQIKKTRIASKDRCHYIGHLTNELTACVAMTGCVGSQDVQFTILSKHAPNSSTFKWTIDGNVELMKVNIYIIQVFCFSWPLTGGKNIFGKIYIFIKKYWKFRIVLYS